MSYYHYLVMEILLLIMAIPILRTRAAEQSPWRNWASNILIVVLVVVSTVWSVDTVLWLEAEIKQSAYAALYSTPSRQAAAPRTSDRDNFTWYPEEFGWIHAGAPGAGHFVKMVHNGIEYGIMQAYAEGFNILHEANAGSKYVKEGDAEVAPMDCPEDYCYDINVAKVAECWRRGSVVGSWLLDLTADVLRRDRELDAFAGGVSDSGEGRWTVHAAVDLGVPSPVISSALWSRFESRRLGAFFAGTNKVLNGMRAMFGGHDVR